MACKTAIMKVLAGNSKGMSSGKIVSAAYQQLANKSADKEAQQMAAIKRALKTCVAKGEVVHAGKSAASSTGLQGSLKVGKVAAAPKKVVKKKPATPKKKKAAPKKTVAAKKATPKKAAKKPAVKKAAKKPAVKKAAKKPAAKKATPKKTVKKATPKKK